MNSFHFFLAAAAPASFWKENEAVLIAVAVLLVVAGLLFFLARRSSRTLLERPPEKKPAPLLPAPPPKPPPAPPKPKVEAPVAPEPVLSPEEKRRLKEEEEARRKEAYRARKAEEAREKEERRKAEEERLAREAEEARRKAEEEEKRKAAEEAEKQRRVQAEAGRSLADGLAKTRAGLMGRMQSLFGGGKALDAEVLASLEEALLSADIGVTTATKLLAVARDGLARKELSDEEKIKGAMRREIERIVGLPDGEIGKPGDGPSVWMVVGVNGAGKTTTIGKLAAKLASGGEKVVLAAGDTFRAAATEQLEIWAKRSGAELVRGAEGSDPGSIAFEAVKRAREIGAGYAIVDTAGRLHTKAPLMEELKKVKRVLAKAQAGAPHEILLVLDSTNGQNALAQARQFNEALGVTGIALTKLDGTAKGGVVVAICEALKIPVRYVGIGEAVADLKPFDPHAYVEALFT